MEDSMNPEAQMRAVAAQRKGENVLKSQKYNESSKKALIKILETKLKTSFIAPLSHFEQSFGFLWGHGKKESELTTDELNYRAIWNAIRTNVLNNGNNQIRAIQNELAQYTVTWNRYQLNFKGTNLIKEQKQ